MSGCATIVKKGSLIQKIDKRLASPKKEYLEELESMKAGDLLSDLAIEKKHGTLRKQEKEHADIEWFGKGEGWWPHLKDKEKKIRFAYIHALKIALEYSPPRPIQTFWLSGVPDTFQCYVYNSGEAAGAVIVFWVTPLVPELSSQTVETPKDLWVIAGLDEIEAMRAKLPDDYVADEPEKCDDGVYLFKSIG
jgi:hypothetical protein